MEKGAENYLNENERYSNLFETGKNSNRLDSINTLLFQLKNDSLINSLYFKYAYHSLKKEDKYKFRYWNRKALNKSYEKKDTLRIAEAHWDLATFFLKEKLIDSAYFNYNQASLYYEVGKEDFLSGMMLLNMAILQKDIKDYAGSEVTTVKAIKKIKSVENKDQLYRAYNNLGIIYKELGEIDKALEYHNKALNIHLSSDNYLLQASSLNNIGNTYKEAGQYDKALDMYETALQFDSLDIKRPRLYAMLLDNRAHARQKSMDTINVLSEYLKAFEVRKSINHAAGVIVSQLHLSEFHLLRGDTLEALSFANAALCLSKDNRNHRDILQSTLILANIDRKDEGYFLRNYIKLNDSLQNKERRVRNKFARIQFETDEFIAQNQQLNEQKRWLIGGSSGALILSFLGIIIFRQKARNRKLKNERDQQKANEEIYKLLLDQENKIESSKLKEKERISKELHDGVLSKLFGIRFNLNHLNSKYDNHSIQTKEEYLDQLHRIENEIRLISHDLQKSQFEEVGFLKLLRKLLEEQTVALKFSPILKADPEIAWERISNPVKMNLYRIIQEALQNIRKHSEATEAIIEFVNDRGFLHINIKDNGKGFELEKKERGIGLTNMKSRTKEIGGYYDIVSSGSGTLITIKILI